jgi:hypothetical protein
MARSLCVCLCLFEHACWTVSCITFAHYDAQTMAFGSLNGHLYLAHTGVKPHMMWSQAAHEDEITRMARTLFSSFFLFI